MAIAGGVDAGKIFDFVLDFISEMEPRARTEYEQVNAQVQQNLGFDIRKDLLESLGHVWTIHTDIQGVILD